ncbi:MAG: hypothetical protein KAQ83_02805 [Nanoarchaeota archaeon]|nr:hypothetical protein [Nanoarchaeota archaeon]
MGRTSKHRALLRSGKQSKRVLNKKAKKSIRKPSVSEKRSKGTLKGK